MRRLLLFAAICCCCTPTTLIRAINHWVLKNDKILQKIDSPFYLREPGNLIAFLDQVRHNDHVESTYAKLLRKRKLVLRQLPDAYKLAEDILEQAKCADEYRAHEERNTYLDLAHSRVECTPAALRAALLAEAEAGAEPVCGDFYNTTTRAHIANNHNRHGEQLKSFTLKQAALVGQPQMATVDELRRLALGGLQRYPRAWQFHTLASYYWRVRGRSSEALNCARLGALLAPPEYKDIPLLSLGTLLLRMRRLDDALTMLTAAVNHAPERAANHVVLAAALVVRQEFAFARQHLDTAERLEDSDGEGTLASHIEPVRAYMACLDSLNAKTKRLNATVSRMHTAVQHMKRLKRDIGASHERLLNQQLPLSARYTSAQQLQLEDLHRRGQYCSTRQFSGADAPPVLVCDFYSDMQMRLQSQEADIELLEHELRRNTEALLRQVYNELKRQLEAGARPTLVRMK